MAQKMFSKFQLKEKPQEYVGAILALLKQEEVIKTVVKRYKNFISENMAEKLLSLLPENLAELIDKYQLIGAVSDAMIFTKDSVSFGRNGKFVISIEKLRKYQLDEICRFPNEINKYWNSGDSTPEKMVGFAVIFESSRGEEDIIFELKLIQ